MTELKELAKSLDKTLKDTDLQNVTVDLSEVLIDSLIDDGITKEIPIIGTIVGLGKATLGIRDSLFLKKIIYFISEFKKIPTSTRHQMIDKIDSSQKYKIRVGEKLLYIIEKCEDHEKSTIIARLFVGFIKGLLTYDEFLRSASIVEKIIPEDLIRFVEDDFEWERLIEVGEYLNTGLVEVELYFEDEGDQKLPKSRGELAVRISRIGSKIKEVLKVSNDR